MAKPETVKTVVRLVAEVSALRPDEVKPGGKLAGYGIDSARVIDLVVALEEAYHITIRESELNHAKLQTVTDLADFVDGLCDAQAG